MPSPVGTTKLASAAASPMPWRSETPDEIYARAVDNEARDFHADAADLYQEAAIRGHLSAMVALGRHLIGLDDLTAVGWFRAAAERGHPTAWTELGHMYARGYGVERSNPHAVMCWQRGATLGDSAARSCLGLSYIQGFGVEKDPDRGIAIVKEIANSGDVISMRNLAWVYRTGRGVPKDLKAADYWDSRAAQAANSDASASSPSRPLLHPPAVTTKTHLPQSSQPPRDSPVPENHPSDHAPVESKPNSETSEPPAEARDIKLDQGKDTTPEVENTKFSPDTPADKGNTEGDESEQVNFPSKAPVKTPAQTSTESFIQGTNIPPKKPIQPTAADEPRADGAVSVASTESKPMQPSLTYLKLVPISQSEETTYLATETTENSVVDSEHPVIAVVKDTSEGTPSGSLSMASIGRKISTHSTHSSHFATDRDIRSPMSPKTKQEIEMPRKGSFWNNNPGNALGGLEVVDNALSKMQSSSRRSSLDRNGNNNGFAIPYVKEAYPDNKNILDGAKFPVQHVEEERFVQEEDSPNEKGSRKSLENSDDEDAEKKIKKQPSALDIARQTIRRHSQGGTEESEMAKVPSKIPPKIAATSSSRQPVKNLIAHIEHKENEKKTGKPATPPPPPPPMPTRPQPPPDLTPKIEIDAPSSSSPVDARVSTPPPVTTPVSPPTPPPASAAVIPAKSLEKDSADTTTASRAVEPKSNEDMDAGFMAEIKSAVRNYPELASDSRARKPVYEFLDAVQRLRADDKTEGEYLVRNSAWDLVVISLFAQPHDVAIQELALHSFIRLLRFIPDDAKEAAVLRSCRDSLLGAGLGHLKLPPGVDETSPGSIQSVLFAMKMYPETRRIQMAGCAAIAELAEVSGSARVRAADLGAIVRIAASLKTRDGMPTVYEMACRAVSGICSGGDLVRLKQAMVEHQVVEEILAGLNKWLSVDTASNDLLLYANRSGCAALRHICTSCEESSRRAVDSNVFESLTKVLDIYQADTPTCTIAISAIIAITTAVGDVSEDYLEGSDILANVLGAVSEHSDDALLVRKALMCIETLATFKKIRDQAVEEGAVAAAIDIAAVHKDARVQEQVCSTIERLCHYCTPGKDAVAASNGMNTIANAMRLHPKDAGVMERAALAASSTCTNHPVNQNSALQLGISSPIVAALALHGRQSDKLVIACSTAITALSQAKDPLMGRKMAREEAPEHLMENIKTHIDSADVVEHASYALATLCVADATLATTLSDQGLESVILAAFKAHYTSSRCVLAILSAIRVMVSKPNKIRTRFMTDQSTGMGLAQLLHMALAHHMDPFPESNMVVLVCGTLNFLAFECVPHKDEIGRTGIFEQLGEMIEVSSKDANVIGLQPSLAAICTLVLNSTENQDRFMYMNGVERILDLMKKWHWNPKVLEHCCIALRYSCNQHAGNCEDVKRLHGVKDLNEVMRAHFNNPRLFEMACLALAVLCQGDSEIQESPVVGQAIKTTCEAMQAFPEDPVVQVAACTMFLSAAFENEGNKKRVVRYGGRTAIVKALEAHPSNLELAEAAAYALIHVENVQLIEDDDQVPPIPAAATKPERRGSRLRRMSSQNRLSRRKSRDRNSKNINNNGDNDKVAPPPGVEGGTTEPPPPERRLSRSQSRRKRKKEKQQLQPSRSFLRFGRRKKKAEQPVIEDDEHAPEGEYPDHQDYPRHSFAEEHDDVYADDEVRIHEDGTLQGTTTTNNEVLDGNEGTHEGRTTDSEHEAQFYVD